MDLVEQIDLTVNPPLWSAIDRRNRVVCEPAPLIYYHPAREREPVPESSTAMGSRDSAEVETSADVAARDGEGEGRVISPLSEPPPTPSVSTDPVFDEATLMQKMAEHHVIDEEVKTGIQEVLVRLGFGQDQLPIFAEQDTLVSYEAKIESWMGQFNDDQKTDAQAVAGALMSGALKKSDINEKYVLLMAKKRRLEKEGEEEEQMKKDLASFDLHQFLLRSSKEQNTFYGQITQILTEMRSAIQEPLRVDQKVMQELASLIQDVGKVSDAQGASQHHAITSIANMTKKLTDMSWEMSAGSIDRRCIPQSNRNGPFLKESMRETLLCIRLALMEVLEGTRANHEVLQQSYQLHQRQCDGTSKMVEILERMEKREQLREKVEAEVAKKKKEAAIASIEAAQKLGADATKTEKDRIAQEEAEKKRALQAELDSANAGIEAAQKRAKLAREAMSPTPKTPAPPPMMPAMPVGPVGYGQPGYGQPCGQPCFMGGMGVMPQQGFPPMPGQPTMQPTMQGQPTMQPMMQPTMPIFEGQQTMQSNMPGTGHQAPL